ncbi:hypothetical protein ACFVXE_12340 [Streptomyces sp. NPDC058231]|uniref:hypothetical protein n=1 Tax=Streptomyces sp. NPDC058231 TaxID=3346392 RepID=UPI0036EE76AB
MKFPTPHVRRTAIALAVSILVVGCSTSRHASPDAPGSSKASPGDGTAPSAGATSGHPSATAAPDLDDWPTRPATADKFPHGIPSTVLAKGYTGSAFLEKVTEKWHIALGPRKKNDFSKKDDQPPVWYATGAGQHASGKLSIAVTWNLSGDLESLSCIAGRKTPGYADFLRDCIELDHPGARPAAAARWLGSMVPSLDKAYAEARKPVGSPLYRAGRAASALQEYSYGKEGMVYTVRTFGTAP